MTRLVALFGCALMMLSARPALAVCESPVMRIYANQAIDRPMKVQSGGSCRLRLIDIQGPTYSAVIVQRPAHGKASVQPPHGVVYVANRGYVGADNFTFERRGLDHLNKPATYTVRVAVTVVP